MKTLKRFTKAFLVLGLITTLFITSCKKNDEDFIDKTSPIVLDCDYFQENRVLEFRPDAPIDYIINCVMQLGGADIVVEPGVVIAFEADAGIAIEGESSFSAVGTADAPIIFKGVKSTAGYWKGIFFRSISANNELSFVEIHDAGGSAFNSNGDRGGIILYGGSKVKITNSKVTNSDTYGINVSYEDVDFVMENNTFTGNHSPAFIYIPYLNALKPSNSFAGNTEDFISLRTYTASLTEESILYKNDVKYRIVHAGGGAPSSFDVKNKLTIEPGVEVEFPQGYTLRIVSEGSLVAVGTESDPIIFNGVQKVAKGWTGIYFDSKSALNEIAYAEIHHSGLGAPKGNIHLWYEAALNIHDTHFQDIDGCAINYSSFSGPGGNPNLTIGDNVTSSSGCVDQEWE